MRERRRKRREKKKGERKTLRGVDEAFSSERSFNFLLLFRLLITIEVALFVKVRRLREGKGGEGERGRGGEGERKEGKGRKSQF